MLTKYSDVVVLSFLGRCFSIARTTQFPVNIYFYLPSEYHFREPSSIGISKHNLVRVDCLHNHRGLCVQDNADSHLLPFLTLFEDISCTHRGKFQTKRPFPTLQ